MPGAHETLDIELGRLSFADLWNLSNYAYGHVGKEWKALDSAVRAHILARATKFVALVREAEAEEATAK